jgi:hypothetical protein
MQSGDLVKLCTANYPHQSGEVGMLISVPRASLPSHYNPKKWAVMIAGKMFPYTIAEQDMVVINESR